MDSVELEALMQGELLSVDVNAEELSTLLFDEDLTSTLISHHQEDLPAPSAAQRTVGAKYKPRHESSAAAQPPPILAQRNDFKTLRADLDFCTTPDTTTDTTTTDTIAAPLKFLTHPPLEVRTRTKNENRTFSCVARVDWERAEVNAGQQAEVRLCYAKGGQAAKSLPILGGTLRRKVGSDGRVVFDDLSVSVASPKHGEKEFALGVRLVGEERWAVSRPFYAYSHKSVLKRRREVRIKALSTAAASTQGGLKMHVVGSPFIRSERLQVVFRVTLKDYKKYCAADVEQLELSQSDGEWVSIAADAVDFFSDSVLFFETPNKLQQCTDEAVNVFVQVTNDGRNFSNPLPFTFYGNQSDDLVSSPSKKLCLLSRM